MTEIIAEAGRITGLGPEISSKIISGLQPAYAKKAGQKPMKCVAPAGQMAELIARAHSRSLLSEKEHLNANPSFLINGHS